MILIRKKIGNQIYLKENKIKTRSNKFWKDTKEINVKRKGKKLNFKDLKIKKAPKSAKLKIKNDEGFLLDYDKFFDEIYKDYIINDKKNTSNRVVEEIKSSIFTPKAIK